MCESFSRETYVCMYGPRQPAAGGIAYVYILTMNVAEGVAHSSAFILSYLSSTLCSARSWYLSLSPNFITRSLSLSLSLGEGGVLRR